MPPQEKLFPNLPPEEQDMELEPVVMGPGAYGSPDPKTAESRLLPAEDNPMRTASVAADEAADLRDQQNYNSMSAADLKKLAEDRELEVEGSGSGGRVTKPDLVAALSEADAADMDSRDFIQRVEAAADHDQLDDAEAFYEDSGKEYSSVEKAIEKRRAELDENES